MEPATPTFDTAKYRQVLGHFPTGVTVVASVHEGEPVGLAVGSFASLSLDPPQVLFCPSARSA
jgi:3-hydroxy-9,10-secoandrosta-1,3,5(10)-triene-9,17-dione monooxygenase reductase component